MPARRSAFVLLTLALLSTVRCAENPITGSEATLAPIDIQASLSSSSFSAGEILVSEWIAGRIRRIAFDGSGSAVFYSGLTHPGGLRVEASGDVVVAENIGNLRRISADGSSSSVIRSGLSIPAGVAIADNGDLIVTEDGSPYRLWRITPDGSSATVIALGIKSEDVEIDADGNFIVLQELGGRILKVTPGGVVTELFCCVSDPSDLVIEQTGDFVVAEFGAGRVTRVASDGTSSDVIYSGLNTVEGVAVAASGDLLVTEFSWGSPGRITRIAPDGSSSSLFFSGLSGPDHLIVLPGLRVDVDVKPGSDPNCINQNSKGVTSVAILTSSDFDPSQVDPASVRLEGVAPLRWSLNKDVNDDSTNDLVLHFKTQELNATDELYDGSILELTGSLKEEFGATPIAGSDVVYLAGGPNCED